MRHQRTRHARFFAIIPKWHDKKPHLHIFLDFRDLLVPKLNFWIYTYLLSVCVDFNILFLVNTPPWHGYILVSQNWNDVQRSLGFIVSLCSKAACTEAELLKYICCQFVSISMCCRSERYAEGRHEALLRPLVGNGAWRGVCFRTCCLPSSRNCALVALYFFAEPFRKEIQLLTKMLHAIFERDSWFHSMRSWVVFLVFQLQLFQGPRISLPLRYIFVSAPGC